MDVHRVRCGVKVDATTRGCSSSSVASCPSLCSQYELMGLLVN